MSVPGGDSRLDRVPAVETHFREQIRLARGWSHFLRLCERIRRYDAGEPLLRLLREDRRGGAGDQR